MSGIIQGTEYSGVSPNTMPPTPDRLYSGLGVAAFRSTDGMDEHDASCRARFSARIDRSAGPHACWPWTGSVRKGLEYGWFWCHGKNRGAHHYALELKLGRPLKTGMVTRHGCDNPPCVNPAHLSEGTVAENRRDCWSKGRNYRPVGELHHMAKLTNADVVELRRLAADGWAPRALAARYGVGRDYVVKIIRGTERVAA